MRDKIEDWIKNKEKLSIGFACSGNIIRSAFADIYLREKLQQHGILDIDVFSFGTTYFNQEIHGKSRKKLEKLGIKVDNYDFEPTHISQLPNDMLQTSLIFAMTRKHLRLIHDHLGSAENSFLLMNMLHKNEEIKDPYFFGKYEQVYKELIACVDQLLEILKTGKRE